MVRLLELAFQQLEKSNVLDTIIIIIRFLSFRLIVDGFSSCILNPGNLAYVWVATFLFRRRIFRCSLLLVASLVFTRRKRGEYRNDGKPCGVGAACKRCERVVSVPRIRYFFGLLFSRRNSRIWRIDNGTRFRRRAIPYRGIIPYRRITHYQRTNIFVWKPRTASAVVCSFSTCACRPPHCPSINEFRGLNFRVNFFFL